MPEPASGIELTEQSPPDSPDRESFLKVVEGEPFTIPRSADILADPYLMKVADYAELVLNDDRRLDVITEGGNSGLGHIAASVRAEFDSADTYDVIAVASRVLLIKSEIEAGKIWNYIEEALAEEGQIAIIEHHQTYEIDKGEAAELFRYPLFRNYLTPSGQQAYAPTVDAESRLDRMIWDREPRVGQ